MASNTLGTILIELKAKTDAFERGMKSAKDLSFTTSSEIVGSLERIGKSLFNLKFNNLDQMGRSLGIVGGIAAATGVALATSIVAVAQETSKKMVEMGHDAEKAGMGIKEFTENAYAAKRSGVPIEEFTASMSKLAKTALAAAQGNAQAQRAFQLAGTSATDAQGRLRPTSDILNDIIKKYDTLTDKTLKAGLAQQVFGRGGSAVVPFLEKGPEVVDAYRKQAEAFGVAFGPETLNAAKQFRGTIAELKASSEGAAIQMTAGLLPAVNQVISGMLKVEGHASLMRSFGETVGEAFKFIAKTVMAASTGFQEVAVAMRQPLEDFANAPFWQKITGIASVKALVKVDPKTAADIDALQRRYEKFVEGLNNPPVVKPVKEEKQVGTAGLNPEANNVATTEIAKLKEKAEGTLALAAAELFGEQSVRATSAAYAADAVILQIATKASKEHKTALEAEIDAARKKYGATVLALTTLEQEATRQQSFNKSLKDQTLDANISADAHKRMAEAILQGGDAVNQASIANQIDQIVRKADLKLTQDQIAALERLKTARREEADAAITEAINRESVSLQNAARATQLLIDAQRRGSDAEIEARAQIEAENFAIRNNIDLKDERIKKMQQEIAANLRASQSQSVGRGIQEQYDPSSVRRRREDEINQALRDGAITAEEASAAKRDAYTQEQESIDRLAMATQRGAAGAAVALRQWLRSTQNWAENMREAVSTVMQGFDTGFRNAFSDMIMGTKSVSAAFAEMGRTMLKSVVDALVGIVAKWIETKIILAALKLFGVDMSSQDPMAKAAPQIAANQALASSYAGLAAAEEFEWEIARTGDIFSAAAMGAVAYGIGEGFATLAAFDNGGIMPKTGVALVHQDEGVLTGPTTKMLVNVNKMVNSMDTGRTAAAMAGGSGSFSPTFHIYGATDADAVADKVMSRVKRHMRTAGVSR